MARDCAIQGSTTDLRPVDESVFGVGVPSCGAVLLPQSFAVGTVKLLSAKRIDGQSSRSPSILNLTVPAGTLTVTLVVVTFARRVVAELFCDAQMRYAVAF